MSHHEQRRSHAVSRTKTQGLPVWVDSPWIEWKISLMVSKKTPAHIVQNRGSGQAALGLVASAFRRKKRCGIRGRQRCSRRFCGPARRSLQCRGPGLKTRPYKGARASLPPVGAVFRPGPRRIRPSSSPSAAAPPGHPGRCSCERRCAPRSGWRAGRSTRAGWRTIRAGSATPAARRREPPTAC